MFLKAIGAECLDDVGMIASDGRLKGSEELVVDAQEARVFEAGEGAFYESIDESSFVQALVSFSGSFLECVSGDAHGSTYAGSGRSSSLVQERLFSYKCCASFGDLMNLEQSPPPWTTGPYSIKRHGVSIQNCDSEPVQTPGCIQAHGLMVVLRSRDLCILQISENLPEHFGKSPEDVLESPVSCLIGEDGGKRLAAFFENERVERNPQYAFTLPLVGHGREYDVLVHRQEEVLVVELEPASTETGGTPDYYGMVKRSVSRLQTAETLSSFCDIVAEEVRNVTGIDRVMVYKFHADFHGEVVAESKREDLSPWLGLHYPAEDIPHPAREIFKKIWVRPLPDAAAPVVEMVPLVNQVTGKGLDMTHCSLRGASVMYTEYLKNMGVAASLTMSLMVDGELWGLIACQHETPTSFPYQIRAACEFLAQVASLQLRSVEQRESFEYRLRIEELQNRVITVASQESSLVPLTEASPNILDAMDAAGVAIFHGGEWFRVGETPVDSQLDGLKEWLNGRPEFHAARPVYHTDSLSRDYPDAVNFADVASGLLAISLSRQKHTYVLWFRPETLQTVNWGGNPHDKPVVTGPHGPRLTPRRSFEIFSESVKHRSLPWKRVEIDSALRLRMLIMELVVSRAEQISELNADLTRTNEELDAFAYVASHDLKEPLRGISKYAHQLMEAGQMEESERREKFMSLQRLALRMDSLLDALLHFSRVGRAVVSFNEVDLSEVLDEALEMVAARRQEIPTEIKITRALPTIPCDRMRVREIFVNLLTNAMKYNDKPQREIEIGYEEMADGPPVFHVRDNGIGIQPRHFESVFKIFRRLHGTDAFGGGSGAGLAIVHRLVSQHRGSVWLDSEPGAGTTFYFTLSESTP